MWVGLGLPHFYLHCLPLGWMARNCPPRAGGNPNLSMVISSQCPLTPRTPGLPVGPEMAWWALSRAVENLLGSQASSQGGEKRCPLRTVWLSQ